MARQKGPLRFEGRVGDLSFYKDKRHGYLIRRKGGPSKRQIKARKSCAGIRQSNEEFGRASRAGKLLRQAFHPLIHHCKEYSMSRRLQALLTALIKADNHHEPGERRLLKQNMGSLAHFELSAVCSLDRYVELPLQRQRTTEGIRVEARLLPAEGLATAATHFELCSVGAFVDFETGRWVQEVQYSGKKRIEEDSAGSIAFEHALKGEGFAFHGLGILFYQEVNGVHTLLNDEKLSAGCLGSVE